MAADERKVASEVRLGGMVRFASNGQGHCCKTADLLEMKGNIIELPLRYRRNTKYSKNVRTTDGKPEG